MKNKAFTLIELLAVIVVLAVILAISVPRVLNVIEESNKESFRLTGENIVKSANNKVIRDSFYPPHNRTYTITGGAFIGEELPMTGDLPDSGTILVNQNGGVAIAIYNGKYCAMKNFEQTKVEIFQIPGEECVIDSAPAISFDGFDATKEVNVPSVAPGLSPIIWNGSSWVNTTVDDPNWFDYNSTDKEWANTISADGSMWVWIPRFAYQINTNYHTYSVNGGVINIKFLKGNSNEANDGTEIDTVPSFVGSTQNNYVVHPAFTFGGVELTGFWMAKFEATMGKTPNNIGSSCANQLDNVTTENIKIVPGISSWRCISVSNAFLNSYSMQSKEAIYGWSDSQVDTHLMKNSEWAAVAFLSQSIYGKGTTNIWMNPNSEYKTGCGGTAAGQNQTLSCIPYNLETRTSTTGNITGVYDMSGGSTELTATYIDNLTVGSGGYTNGVALVTANPKYSEKYPLGITDTAVENHNASENIIGAGIWEMSISGSVDNNGWYQDNSLMPNGSSPWLIRGGFNRSFNGAGLFAFDRSGGGNAPDYSFRPVVIVESGV